MPIQLTEIAFLTDFSEEITITENNLTRLFINPFMRARQSRASGQIEAEHVPAGASEVFTTVECSLRSESISGFWPPSVEDVSYGVSVGFVDANVGALSAVYPLFYAVIIVGWDAGALVELAF